MNPNDPTSAMLLGQQGGQGGGMPPGGGMQPGMGMPPPGMSQPNPDAIMQQFMQIDQAIDAIATQFPQAGEEARMLKDGLKQMLVKVVQGQQVNPPQAPRVV